MTDAEYYESHKNDEKEDDNTKKDNDALRDSFPIEVNETDQIPKNETSAQTNTVNNKKDKDEYEGENAKKDDVSSKNNKHNIDVLDLLLNFVMNDNRDINYVLAGYFSCVFIEMIHKSPNKILGYLYNSKPDVIERIIYHSNIKAISLVAIEVLNLEKVFVVVDNDTKTQENIKIEKAINYRNDLIVKLVKSINPNELKLKDSSENMLLLLQDLISDNQDLLTFILNSNEIIDHIFSILSVYLNHKSNAYNEALHYIYSNLLSFVIFLIKQSKDKQLPTPYIDKAKSVLSPYYWEKILLCLDKIINNFEERKNCKKVNFQNNQEVEFLGPINQKIIELIIELFDIMKSSAEKFDSILIENGFFKQAIAFFFKYQWNDFYLQNFVTLIKNYLKTDFIHKEFNKYLFETLRIQDLLIKSLNKDVNFTYASGNIIKSGLFPHLISLSYKINTIIGNKVIRNRSREGSFRFVLTNSSNNIPSFFNTVSSTENSYGVMPDIKEYILTQEWNKFIKMKVAKEVKLYEKKLCDTSLSADNSEISEGEQNDMESHLQESIDNKTKSEEFQFVEESNVNQEESKFVPEKINIKVDEIEEGNYTNTMFWKGNGIYSEEEMNKKVMEDLEL